jgi:predicted Zn-dependent protease
LSLCARKSNGRLWCGTCHDPHDRSDKPPQYYRSRCLSCHKGTLSSSHPGGSNSDCVACHMSKRNAKDGGHTVFTDHRISRRPESEQEEATSEKGELVPWREPPPALRERNLAIAYVNGGFESHSASQIVRGLHMLTEVEKQFPDDPAVLTALGQALLSVNKPTEAAQRFERVLQLGPDSAVNEENAGTAWMQAGRMDKAVDHLERAFRSDPLLLPVAQALMEVYRQQDDEDKASALADRVRRALGSAAPRESSPDR